MQEKCQRVLKMMNHITKTQQSFGYQFVSLYNQITNHELLTNEETQFLVSKVKGVLK